MPGPNNINRSNQSNPVDPYSDEWLNEGYDGGYGNDSTDRVGEDYSQSAYQNTEDNAPTRMTGTQAAEQIKALYDHIKKDPNININEKNKQLKELQSLYGQAKSYGNKDVPASFMNEVGAFEAERLSNTSIDGEGSTEDEEGDLRTQIQQTKNKITELKTKINASDLSSQIKSEMNAKLDRANTSLDISATEEQLSNANETMSAVNTSFEEFIAQPKIARDLSAKLNKPIEEITGAAQEAGLNLDSLPHPPNEKVIKMLNSLGIPSETKVQEWQTLKDARDRNISALKSDILAEVESWKQNTSNTPPASKYQQSWKYWKKEDDDYRKMTSKIGEAGKEIADALNALGYSASPGQTGDKISIDGTEFDFFNEDSASFGLNTTATSLSQNADQFAPAYNNTEADNSNFPDDNYDWYREHAPEGYPTGSFTVD